MMRPRDPKDCPEAPEAESDGGGATTCNAPAADLDRLFERYHRGSNVSGIVGTGVGLYLVKMVVDMHGGAVAVESREDKGSRFTVRLPRKSAAAVKTMALAEAPSLADPPDALRSVLSPASERGEVR